MTNPKFPAKFNKDLLLCFTPNKLLPNRKLFSSFLSSYEGMANKNTLALLNHAVRLMSDNNIYLEVGSYKGKSLIGSCWNNPSKRGIGFENFHDGTNFKNELNKNIVKSKLDNITCLSYDYAPYLLTNTLKARSVGVYFYDGNHNFFDQLLHFLLIEKYLDDNALVFIDDTSAKSASFPIYLILLLNQRFKLQFIFDSDTEYWRADNLYPLGKDWNGIHVLAYSRMTNVEKIRKTFGTIVLVLICSLLALIYTKRSWSIFRSLFSLTKVSNHPK